MPSDNGDATPPPCPTLHTNKPVTMFASDGACSCATFEQIRALQSDFANRRDWNQYHTPRNLVLALVGEVGELSEIFQWRGDGACKPGLPEWSDKDKVHLSEELADVALYLIRLSERCGIDLPLAIESKLKKNNDKYPADKVKGKSAKYTYYQNKAKHEQKKIGKKKDKKEAQGSNVNASDKNPAAKEELQVGTEVDREKTESIAYVLGTSLSLAVIVGALAVLMSLPEHLTNLFGSLVLKFK